MNKGEEGGSLLAAKPTICSDFYAINLLPTTQDIHYTDMYATTVHS